jgi:spermidine synthase
VEIAAARLLAPYFGASTIVWANTIGVVLVALSVGYWFGGRYADRHPHLRGLCLLVLAASLLIAVVPFAARPFLGFSVDAFDTVSVGGFAGSLFGVLVLVAVPVTLLGAAAPWAVRLAVADVDRSGEIVGRLYAISTAGSLIGTMLSALLLIPLLGTQRTFFVFALALALVATLGVGWRFVAVPALLALAMALPIGTIKAADTGRVLYEAETTQQYARVVERPDGSRALELNEGQAVHSLWRPGTYLTGDYWDGHLVLAAASRREPPRRIAILGNAGGTVARAFGHFFPGTAVDAVEIDGELTELGRRYLDLRNPRMRTYAEDARPWLERSEGPFDAIMVDAYRQPYIPFYLTTREFFELARERLAPGGLVIVNVGHPEGSDELERVLGRTMAAAFPRVLRYPIEPTNTLLVGGDGDFSGARLRGNVEALPPALRPLAVAAAAQLAPRLPGGEVYTDDHAPVEWLVDSSLLEYANE